MHVRSPFQKFQVSVQGHSVGDRALDMAAGVCAEEGCEREREAPVVTVMAVTAGGWGNHVGLAWF